MKPKRKIIPLFVPHVGCPNECVFCNQKRISGSLFPVTAATVSRTLAALPTAGGFECAFYGGSFTAIAPQTQEELLSVVLPFLRDGTVTSIRVSTRPDAVGNTELERLLRFGVKTVELGAQSMSDAVLRASGRGHTPMDTEKAAQTVKAKGLSLILQMMTGLPGDTEELSLSTARQLINLRPDAVRIYPTVILKDTALEKLWRDGRYVEHTVEDAVSICARILPLFEEAGIPVIRVGLNPTPELSNGGVLGGAYHPALGELVRSRILLQKAIERLRDIPPGSSVILGVAPACISTLIGQRRENIILLQKQFRLHSLSIRGTQTDACQVSLLGVEIPLHQV